VWIVVDRLGECARYTVGILEALRPFGFPPTIVQASLDNVDLFPASFSLNGRYENGS